MADENSRYNVTITMDVQDATSGTPTEFSKTIQQYFDMKYEHLAALQTVAIPALVEALTGMGNQLAEEIQGKRLAKGQNK